jgi:hypothetical protein
LKAFNGETKTNEERSKENNVKQEQRHEIKVCGG